MSSRNASNGKPRAYALEKTSMLRARQRDARIMEPLRRAGAVIFPGIPIAALLGFTSFCTSPTENTTEASRTQRFHEGGLFQVEMGPRVGPAPNPDPDAPNNTYGRLASSPTVKQALGQSANGPGATMEPDAWKRPEHWADQIAVGLAGILSHVSTLGLDGRIAPRNPASSWYWNVAMMAFSRGNGQARSVLNAYAGELAGVPEERRWRAFRAAVARDIVQGTGPAIGRRAGVLGAAYAIVRCDQKAESGRAVADATEARWFVDAYADNASDNAIEQTIAECAYSANVTTTLSDLAVETSKTLTDVALIAADAARANPVYVLVAGVLLLIGAIAWYESRDQW